MSYTIDFQRLAIRCDIKKGFDLMLQRYPQVDQPTTPSALRRMFYPYSYFAPLILVLAELGDNNTLTDEGKVARSWRLLVSNTEPMRDIISHAGDAESGYLRLNGRHTQAEGYIRTYRKLIEEAIPSEALLAGQIQPGLKIILHGLSQSTKEYDAGERYRMHPHTLSLIDRGDLVEDVTKGTVTVRLDFSDPELHALDMAWLYAVKDPSNRPSLDWCIPSRVFDSLVRAKACGVYGKSLQKAA